MLLHPLGYPVNIVSNADPVLRAASGLWASWPQLFQAPELQIEVPIQPSPAPSRPPQFAPPVKLNYDEFNFAEFDPERRSGVLSISGDALDTTHFRHHFLEALVLTALDAVFFTPLHAACVAREGAGILLCGDSGAGKSSLAYACAHRGWTLVSDDAVHLAPGPERIGVGGSNIIHLREPARELFPRISELDTGTAPNGKEAIEIDAAAHGFRTARHATTGQSVSLERRAGHVH